MFKSNNREIQSLNEYVYTYNDSLRDTKCVVYKEDSVTFPLTVQQVKRSDGSVIDVRVSDVDLLLNQKRLEKISPTTLQSLLDNLKAQPNAPKGKFTDDELMMFIKSRHIQAPSDVAMWSDYLSSLADDMNIQIPTDPAPTDPAPTDPAPTDPALT